MLKYIYYKKKKYIYIYFEVYIIYIYNICTTKKVVVAEGLRQ